MRLMDDLAGRLGISYLYITHDLAVARYACTRIAVMYLGKLMEVGETEDLLRQPQHPYTQCARIGGAGTRPFGHAAAGQHTGRGHDSDRPAGEVPVLRAVPDG